MGIACTQRDKNRNKVTFTIDCKNVNATLLRFLSHCVHAIPKNGPQFTKLSNHSRQNTSFPFFTIDDTSEEIDECGAVINSISFADSLLMCQKGINFVVSILLFSRINKEKWRSKLCFLFR